MKMFFNTEALKMGWQESLDAFKPTNLGLLLLVSLRALKDMYKALLRAFFLPIALIAGAVLELRSLLSAFYITLILRAARPSVDLKKGTYWSHYDGIDVVLFVGVLLLYALQHAFAVRKDASGFAFLLSKGYNAFLKMLLLGNFAWLPDASVLGELIYVLSPFVILWVLFMLDSQKTVWHYFQAFGRACLMLFYNYPFFLFSYLFVRLSLNGTHLAAHWFTEAMHGYLPLVGWVLLIVFFIPLYACFIMSFYVKQVHAQFGLYYRT